MFSFLKKKSIASPAPFTLKAFVSGNVIPIEEVKDPVFSGKMLGEGLAIEPTDEWILAPCDGVISTVMEDSRHAVGITASNGMELLIHEGIDTISLNGEGFTLCVKEGYSVKAGEKLSYEVGDRVRHMKFGEGLVTGIVEGGRDFEVTVQFDDFGTKKMFASFAKLQKCE